MLKIYNGRKNQHTGPENGEMKVKETRRKIIRGKPLILIRKKGSHQNRWEVYNGRKSHYSNRQNVDMGPVIMVENAFSGKHCKRLGRT